MPTGTIIIQGGTVLNQSGIALDVLKLVTMPAGWNDVDGYQEDWHSEDASVTRVFQGPWGGRKQFIDWLLGYSTNVTVTPTTDTPTPGTPTPGTPTTGVLRRVIPAQHPLYPWLYASDASRVVGQGAIGLDPNALLRNINGQVLNDPVSGQPLFVPLIAYYDRGTNRDDNCCRVAVTYRPRDYEIRSDKEMDDNGFDELQRYVSREENDALQALPIPGFALKFAEGPLKGTVIPEQAVNMLMPTKELIYVWHDVPDVPEVAIATCQGKVNDAPFDVPRKASDGTTLNGWSTTGYPAGTLLCMAPQKRRQPRSVVGRVTWRITYRFLYRPQGHNRYPQGGNFYLATSDGTPNGQALYSAADFSSLFKMPGEVLYQSFAG